MKILHISKYCHPFSGGIENFVRDLAGEQARCGNEVRILCHNHQRGQPDSLETMDGVGIARAATPLVLAHAPIGTSMPRLLGRELREFQPDIIHAHMPNLAPFWLLGRRTPPIVIHWHSDVLNPGGREPDRALRLLYPAYAVFERALLRKASAIIATSPPYLESSPPLRRFRDKCAMVPLGLDPERAAPCQSPRQSSGRSPGQSPGQSPNQTPDQTPDQSFERPDSAPLILSVGRFAFYKGFEDLVRAAVLVPEAEFVMAGDGPLRPAVVRLAEKLGLGRRIRFPGKVSDAELARLLENCDIFCLPSTDRREAFGVTLIEAMSRSKPLVSTAIPGSGTGWVNVHGETGLVVPPSAPEALAEALIRLGADPELRRSMGRAARARFEARFHIASAARGVEAVYERLGARKI